ncbi:MAG: FxsA family protein [Candidatus Sumerlaeia bacterium]|nr:FxsA family protein [Candidatus Sumerlaeia bacterium]
MTPPKRPLPIGLILFSLFIVVPICELVILVWLTRVTSFPFTLGVILLSALAGATLVRLQGFAVIQKLRQKASQGAFPGDQILDGLMVLLAGGLMLTPGLLTDVVGFTMLIPASRRILREGLKRIFKGRVHVAVGGFPGGAGGGFGFRTENQPPRQENEDPSHLEDSESSGHFEKKTPFDRLKK